MSGLCCVLRGAAKAGLTGFFVIAAMARAYAAGAESNAALQPVTNSTDLVRLAQNWVSQNHVSLWVAYLAVTAVIGFAFWRFRTTDLASRLRRTLEDEVLTNWRLTLLGITSLALTLASGWTTWDGMTNFTGTPVLSFLITLGIQGVMLIAAWLIGESFAIGLASPGRGGKLSGPDWVLAALAVLLLASAFYAATMAATYHGTIQAIDGLLRRHKSELALPIPTENLRILIALGVSALLTLLIVTQREVFEPYFRGLKVILKGLPLWLMFLSCMGTSVFFSFDSLFSTIFPQAERERAAQLRTTNQVAGIVADLGTTITKRQADSIDGLFTSAQWTEYSSRINDIIAIARGAPEQLAELTRKELEDQQSQRAGFQERKASAASQQVRLDKHKEELLADVNKLKEETPPLAAEVDRLKSEIFKKDGEIAAKKAETQAEAGGVGGTLKAGQGPIWQQRRKELDDFAKLKAITEGELADRAAQLKHKRDRIASAEAELAQLDGEIGKLKGEMDVADKQMAAASAPKPEGSLAATTETMAATGFTSLEDAFAKFRQHPERPSFEAIQQQCAALLGVFDKVPAIKAAAAAKGVRCDPSVVAEPVSAILALNDGLAAYKGRCAKPDSLPQSSVDDLLTFGQQCVQSSGLGAKDTVSYRSQINSIGLNRDDKAHRFVVSWNAFLDGNRLAYLALLIAIALDGLVFMSGVFGANATSSPLVRLPSATRRSAADLEATMYAALRPDIYGRAKLIINALHPITPHDGFVSEIRLADYGRDTAASIRSVLSMAGQFGAVEPDPRQTDVFLVRGELTEFLSKACERELRINPKVQAAAEAARAAEAERHLRYEQERQSDVEKDRRQGVDDLKEERELQRRAKALEPVLSAALIPERIDDQEALFHQATRVLAQMRPTADRAGFTSEIELGGRGDDALLRSVLNAAAARKAVQKDTAGSGDIYLLRPEFTLCLTAIRVKAYEDWQRRASKPRMFPWLRARDGKAVDAAARPAAPVSAVARLAERSAGPVAALAPPAPAPAPQAKVIAIPPPASHAAPAPRLSVPTTAMRRSVPLSPYLDEVKRQLLVTDDERAVLDAILRNDWVNSLDGSFSHLSADDEFNDVLRASEADSGEQLGELDQRLPNAARDLNPAQIEEIRDAVLVLNRLTALRSYLRQHDERPASQHLLAAVNALIQGRANALRDFEAAVMELTGGHAHPKLVRTADFN